MPRGDKSGPMGQGAMTGRKLGLCTGNDSAGFTNQENRMGLGLQNKRSGRGFGIGRGRGQGLGRGLGFRNQNFATGRSLIEEENSELRNEVNQLKARLEKLEKNS